MSLLSFVGLFFVLILVQGDRETAGDNFARPET